MGRTWKRWLGIGLSLALIIGLIHKVDLGLLRRSFTELDVFWLGPMVFIYLSIRVLNPESSLAAHAVADQEGGVPERDRRRLGRIHGE